MNININLDYYKIFYEVAKYKNITKASNVLFISQPAITQTIKKLEETLNAKLFLRHSKGVILTPIGQKIFNQVENALKSFENVENIAKNEEELLSGQISISCGSNIAKKILIKSIIEFNSLFPNINIKLEDNVQKISINKLEKGDLDILISQKNPEIKSLTFKHLCSEKYVIVTKNDDSIQDKVILMSEGTYSRQIFDYLIKKNNLQFKNTIIASGYNIAIELCKSGLGLMLAPLYLVEDLIKTKILKTALNDIIIIDTQDFGFYINENNLTKITKEFIKILIKNNMGIN